MSDTASTADEVLIDDWDSGALNVQLSHSLMEALDSIGHDEQKAKGERHERVVGQQQLRRFAGEQPVSLHDPHHHTVDYFRFVHEGRPSDAWSSAALDHSADTDADVCNDEESDLGAQSLDPKSLHATKRHLSFDRKKGRLKRVTEEDFPAGALRESMKIIMAACRSVYLSRIKHDERVKAFEWLFRDDDDYNRRHALTMQMCCAALRVRPFVVRTRLMYELSKRWVVFDEPVAGLLRIPAYLADELWFRHGALAVDLLRLIWSTPGITTNALQVKAPAEAMKDLAGILARCVEDGYLIERTGFWYATGRNPEVRSHASEMRMTPGLAKKARETPWSQLWPDDEF